MNFVKIRITHTNIFFKYFYNIRLELLKTLGKLNSHKSFNFAYHFPLQRNYSSNHLVDKRFLCADFNASAILRKKFPHILRDYCIVVGTGCSTMATQKFLYYTRSQIQRLRNQREHYMTAESSRS